VASDPAAIPTVELARVSFAADVLLHHFSSSGNHTVSTDRLHAEIMELLEPELARTAQARSTIAAQRQAIAELQATLAAIAIASAMQSPVDWLRAMPVEERQAFNVHVAAAMGSGGTLLGGIQAIGDRVLPWLADRLEQIGDVPNNRHKN